MKQELLEHLVRLCIREVIQQKMSEATKGAAAPPMDGQGSGDQIEVPKDDDGKNEPLDTTKTDKTSKKKTPNKPSEPSELPDIGDSPDKPDSAPEKDMKDTSTKGTFLVDPRYKSSLSKITLNPADMLSVDRTLKSVVSRLSNSVEIPKTTINMVKSSLNNPNAAIYLYLKYDPTLNKVILMADANYKIAKDSNVPANRLNTVPFPTPVPQQAQPKQMAPMNEELKSAVKKIVNEVLNRK